MTKAVAYIPHWQSQRNAGLKNYIRLFAFSYIIVLVIFCILLHFAKFYFLFYKYMKMSCFELVFFLAIKITRMERVDLLSELISGELV